YRAIYPGPSQAAIPRGAGLAGHGQAAGFGRQAIPELVADPVDRPAQGIIGQAVRDPRWPEPRPIHHRDDPARVYGPLANHDLPGVSADRLLGPHLGYASRARRA